MKQGEVIKKFGREWVVLDTEYQTEEGAGVLLQATEIWTHRKFDEDHNYYPDSDIKRFLEACTRSLAEDNFGTVELSMLADDGTGWDESPCKVKGLFLLTEDMYREYRQWIPKLPDWWWLSTADSFYGNKYSGCSHLVRLVNAGGSLSGSNAYRGGVAPALILLS